MNKYHFSSLRTIITILLLPLVIQKSDGKEEEGDDYYYKGIKGINFQEFINLLHTESVEEYNFPNNGSILKDAWNKQTTIDWMRIEEHIESNG